jgi:propanol-preferring alcohol dehydrogenase
MKAMILNNVCSLKENRNPLNLIEFPVPVPQKNEILIKVSACGVCHTELDEIEGRTPPSILPIILGHQIIGKVEQGKSTSETFKVGDRVGVAWIFSACKRCAFCLSGNENLCSDFKATGRDSHGGYAEFVTVPEDFAFRIPEVFSDSEAAPLLCAGAIGYRSLRLTALSNGENIGLTGFGASAHIVIKIVKHVFPDSRIFVFTRTESERYFSKELGASWAGDIGDESPDKLHAIIDTTPVWRPVVKALGNLEKGGRLVINAIRKEDVDKESLLNIDYAQDLWMEKEIKSVANITRKDVEEFLQLAAEIPVKPEIQEFRLEEANRALLELKERKIRGAKVLRIQ